MKILFIGGTGRLSSDVAKLAVQNNEVFLFTRGSSERKIFEDKAYHMITGDIRKPEQAKEKLRGISFDVVIDFLSYTPTQMETTLDIIDGTYSHYIFISSATVYEKSNEHEIISENTTKKGNKKWAYAYNKFLCENFLTEYFAHKKDIHYTIIRPYITYNCSRVPYPLVPRNNALEYSLIYRIKKDMPIPTFDQGTTITTLTHSSDFAKVIIGLIGNECAYNTAIHIASDTQTNWGEVLDTIDKILNTKCNRVDFTQEAIYTAIPIYKDILLGDKGTYMVFDNSKLHSILPDFAFETNLEDGLTQTLDFYSTNPDMQLIDYRWMGQIDRLCNSRHSAYEIDASTRQYITYLLGYHKSLGNFADFLLRILSKIRF